MVRHYPTCIASDDKYLYAAVLDKFVGDGNFLVLRSQAYPSDFSSTKWEQLAQSTIEYVGQRPLVNSCTATNGAFMVLFEGTKNGVPLIRWVYHDSNNTEKNEKRSVHTGSFHCESETSKCDGRILGVPESSPAKFNFFYRQEPSNEFKIASFEPMTGTFGFPNATLETMIGIDTPIWSDYLVDYLNPWELGVAKIELLDSNTKNSTPFPLRIGQPNPVQNVIYSISEAPIRLVTALHEGNLVQFVPVPAANGAHPTWAISYVENSAVYGFHLSGPKAGSLFSDSKTYLSTSDASSTWSICFTIVLNGAALYGLVRLIRQRRRR
ncbi:hypothetical protein DFQ27_006343 [Actinomortierella ambigua]|uniref:Uncharacterized protein n=1 Tax=Actinomortierella ambigua TaxID=1343610 RepID=A0A9P6QGY8_9FUNG|nr:hypothetical protein DFQ27_006343 [Actinomortierella ambigua]